MSQKERIGGERTEAYDPSVSETSDFRFSRRSMLRGAVATGAFLALGAGTASATTISVTGASSSGLTPTQLANTLVGAGTGITISNATLTGNTLGAGTFSNAGSVVGIDSGIILSSGRVTDVIGPNDAPNRSFNLGTPGDADLDALVSGGTFNATALEFDFTVPEDAESVFFRYVFGSEEYNEFVGTQFNDVFAFFLNGTNVALVPDPATPGGTIPAAINNINNGQPGVQPTNPDLYVNNDPFRPDSTGTTVPSGDLVDTQMDGFTVVLDVASDVAPGSTNTLKLAIADRGDNVYDSWVLIEAGSLTTTPPCQTCESAKRLAKYEFQCVETDPDTGECVDYDFVLVEGDDHEVAYPGDDYADKDGETFEPVAVDFETEFCLWAVVKAGQEITVQELIQEDNEVTVTVDGKFAISFVEFYCTEEAAQAAADAFPSKGRGGGQGN